MLDSGFLILSLFVNIGSFITTLIVVHLVEKFNYPVGFMIVGVFFILSIIYPFFLKENLEKKYFISTISFNYRFFYILAVTIFVGLFWIIYNLSTNKLTELSLKFKDFFHFDFLKSTASVWYMLPLIPISIILIIVWTYYYYSQLIKLITGFSLFIISFGILLLIPGVSTENQLILYLLSIIILGLSEIHITPIVYATITRYVNPRYLAIAIGLSTIPVKTLFFLLVLLNGETKYDIYPIKYLLFAMVFTLLILMVLVFVFRKSIIVNNNYIYSQPNTSLKK